jgi:hypothetical protein
MTCGSCAGDARSSELSADDDGDECFPCRLLGRLLLAELRSSRRRKNQLRDLAA